MWELFTPAVWFGTWCHLPTRAQGFVRLMCMRCNPDLKLNLLKYKCSRENASVRYSRMIVFYFVYFLSSFYSISLLFPFLVCKQAGEEKCLCFSRIRGAEQQHRASAGLGVRVRLRPCHEAAGLAQGPCIGSPSGSSPALCSHKGNWGRQTTKKGKSKPKHCDVLQQCVFVSFLKALPKPHFSFYWLAGLRFSGCFPTGAVTGTCLSPVTWPWPWAFGPFPSPKEERQQQDVDCKNETWRVWTWWAGPGRGRWVKPHKELPVCVLPQPLWAKVERLVVLS